MGNAWGFWFAREAPPALDDRSRARPSRADGSETCATSSVMMFEAGERRRCTLARPAKSRRGTGQGCRVRRRNGGRRAQRGTATRGNRAANCLLFTAAVSMSVSRLVAQREVFADLRARVRVAYGLDRAETVCSRCVGVRRAGTWAQRSRDGFVTFSHSLAAGCGERTVTALRIFRLRGQSWPRLFPHHFEVAKWRSGRCLGVAHVRCYPGNESDDVDEPA